MFGFGDASDYRDQAYDEETHQSSLSHEVVAGGAAFEAMHLFEKRQREKGESVSHPFAKEMLAAIAGGEVDKIFETKGLDSIDGWEKQRAKDIAGERAEAMYDQHYGDMDQYDPYARDAPEAIINSGRW